MKAYSVGYSFDGENIFAQQVRLESMNMVELLKFLDGEMREEHGGKGIEDLMGLSILIKEGD